MNNREAITLLRNLEDSLDSYCELNEEGKTAFRMAIEALNCSEFPNNSDTINRQAAIDALERSKDKTAKGDIGGFYNTIIQNDIDKIKGLPSARPEQKSDIEEAVEYIKNAQEYLRDIGETWCADYLSDAIELLVGGEEKRMIPIKIERREPVMRWTPVSERLPEEGRNVLVSVHFLGLEIKHKTGWNDHIKESWYVDIASQIDGEWTSASDEYKVAKKRHIVTAWMPLPEPWKGEEDENQNHGD